MWNPAQGLALSVHAQSTVAVVHGPERPTNPFGAEAMLVLAGVVRGWGEKRKTARPTSGKIAEV